jgi:hypothetical protein
MGQIQCEPVCERAVGSATPSPVAQAASAIGFLGTVFGVFGKVTSLAEAPWWAGALIIVTAFAFVGLSLVALLWLTVSEDVR